MDLSTLPTELYYSIISLIPQDERQRFVLNLSRAIPRASVPQQSLFENVSVKRFEQVHKLYSRLCLKKQYNQSPTDSEESSWVKTFSLLSWEVDPETLVNLMAVLPCLTTLKLNIGPSFTPEHVEQIMKNKFTFLKTLNLRFCLYVQSARYYQFLAGAYFEPAVATLAQSDQSALTSLSIIQDPIPPPLTGTQRFAQPIVFFSLEPFTSLGLSPVVQEVTHLRLRIPGRHLIHCFGKTVQDRIHASYFPKVQFCDFSTCLVDARDLSIIINDLGNGNIRHVILDSTGLCPTGTEWEYLGRAVGAAGVIRARNREKLIKAAIETFKTRPGSLMSQDGPSEEGPRQNHQDIGRPRRGRKGLAISTISIRDTREINAPVPNTTNTENLGNILQLEKIRVLPSLPQLRSLCVQLPRHLQESPQRQQHEDYARKEFEEGWYGGIKRLRSIWERFQQSQKNNTKVFAFDDRQRDVSDIPPVLYNLREVGRPDEDIIWNGLNNLSPPQLCLSGGRGENRASSDHGWLGHPDGCGHQISFSVWGDNL